MDPLVSIIVLTYNSQKHILETFESIKAQTHQNLELIVSDDCSTDDTVDVSRKWIADNGGRFVRTKVLVPEHNTGIPANCNRGIREAKGEWIKLLAGDDLLFPDAIETFVKEIKNDRNHEKHAFHGKVMEFYDTINHDRPSVNYGEPCLQDFNRANATAEEQFNILLRFCPVHATTVLLKKTIFDQVGYFDERFKFWEDRPMWLKMTSHGIRFHFINADIAKYRRHSASVQVNNTHTLFSRTLLSKDEGYKKIVLPHLPFTERILYQYIIAVRRMFLRISRNKKSLFINVPYKALVILPEKWLSRIKRHFKP